MYNINNVDGLSTSQVCDLVSRGGKFVIYTYCISLGIVTLRHSSRICFIEPGESSVVQGLGWFFLSFLLGWWGIPWVPIYTIGSMYNVLSGGKNVTLEVMDLINQSDPEYRVIAYKQRMKNNSSSYGAGLNNNSTYNIP